MVKGELASGAAPSSNRASASAKVTWELSLSTNDNQGAVLEEIDQGAARDAGLEEGDVIIKMDSTIIKGRSDLLRFLSKTDPNNLVKVKVRRGQQEIEKSIALGDPPADSGHVADRMERSGRRDGFSKVFSHDADLQPQECGGPLYDWQGNLVGLNIARNSRVRSYAIPHLRRSGVYPEQQVIPKMIEPGRVSHGETTSVVRKHRRNSKWFDCWPSCRLLDWTASWVSPPGNRHWETKSEISCRQP